VVAVRIDGAPPGAAVFTADGRPLGVAPGPLTLPWSEQAQQIEIRAKGYRPERRTITADRDLILEVSLEKKARPKAGGKRPKIDDIEEAF
jgi:hypothetical protein